MQGSLKFRSSTDWLTTVLVWRPESEDDFGLCGIDRIETHFQFVSRLISKQSFLDTGSTPYINDILIKTINFINSLIDKSIESKLSDEGTVLSLG